MAEFTEVSGISLAYDVAGGGEPPIVFVHGWSCDRSYLAPQVEYFAPTARRAGPGPARARRERQARPGPGRYDVDVLADDVLAVAARGRAAPPGAGRAQPGRPGRAVRAARPGALSALVMVDPAPITNERVKAYFRESADTVRADHDRSWRTEFAKGFFLPTDTVRRDEIIAGVPGGRRRGSRRPSCRPWASSTGRARSAGPPSRCCRSARPTRPTPRPTCAAPAPGSRLARRSGPVTSTSSKCRTR